MLRYSLQILVSALLLLVLTACSTKIGDECRTNNDCAGAEARSCDTSSPGGYCTIFNCEVNECPEESVCVDFGEVSACMRRCDKKSCGRSDEGYECREDIGPVPFCYQTP